MDFQKLLEENESRVKEAAIGAIEAQIKQHIEWRMPDVISGQVSKWFDEHIAPEVVKYLDDNKAGILAGIAKHLESLTDELGKAMFEHAQKRLAEQYSRKAILKELFTG